MPLDRRPSGSGSSSRCSGGASRRRRYARLPLAELEAAAGLGAAVLLALDDAAVAGQETLALDRDAQCRLIAGQCGRDAMTDSARLAGQPAALDGRFDVVLALAIRDVENLIDDQA